MEILKAVLLGVIEGFTEFLPISSTGHLIIAEEYLGFKDSAKIFTVVIQLGAIAAVIWYYRKDLASKISGLIKKQTESIHFFKNVFIATIPAGIAGVALNEYFKTYATPVLVAIALIIGALILLIVDNKTPLTKNGDKLEFGKISSKQALQVGLFQCVALIPGVSRSGAAIVGGLVSGLNRVTATGFSFYLAILVLGGASAFKLVVDGGEISSVSGGGLSIVVGAVAAFIVGLLAVSWLLKYVSTHNFRIFVYYRIILGVAVLALLA